MTDTTKRNEEIAYAIITEPNDHMGVQRIIEALNTKDRERDEAVAEAIKNTTPRVGTALHQVYEWVHQLPKGQMLEVRSSDRVIVLSLPPTPQEVLQDNSKDHE